MEPSALKDTWNYIICNKKSLKVSFSISNGWSKDAINGWMDDLAIYIHFNYISVISGRFEDYYEELCAMTCHVVSNRILPLVKFQTMTQSLVWSPNRKNPSGCCEISRLEVTN